MTEGIEQTRAAPKELPPLQGRINWWGLLGLLCVASSAFLTVTIFREILEFLEAAGFLKGLPFFG
jgi:hypothetical protein